MTCVYTIGSNVHHACISQQISTTQRDLLHVMYIHMYLKLQITRCCVCTHCTLYKIYYRLQIQYIYKAQYLLFSLFEDDMIY
jgi:hypothetical protein